MSRQGPLCRAYFFAEQAQPQPDDFLSSCFAIVPVSAHSGHFFGLHLPSLVAPHFSHLKTAISSSFFESVIFGGAAVPELSQGKPRAGACVVSLKLKIRTSKIIIMQKNFASYLLGPKRPGSPGIVFTESDGGAVFVKYAVLANDSWVVETVSDDASTPTGMDPLSVIVDLAYDSTGIPAVCYNHVAGESGGLRFAIRSQ